MYYFQFFSEYQVRFVNCVFGECLCVCARVREIHLHLVEFLLPHTWSHGQQPEKKSIMLVCRCHQLLSGLLANGHLLQVSRQSLLSANDKSDNKTKPGAVYRSPGICLTAKENLRKLS